MTSKKAFTMIELLVVVLIIAILAAVALPQYRKSVDKSRIAEVTILAKAFSDAGSIFIITNGDCPASADELDMTIPASDKFTYTYDKNNNCLFTITPKGRTYKVYAWLAGTYKGRIFCNAADSYAEELCATVAKFDFTGNPSNTKYYRIR